MTEECFRCGAPGVHAFGNSYLCDGCVPNGATAESSDADDSDDTWHVEPGTYPPDLPDIIQWLVWKPTDDGRKVPRAPWETGGDRFVSAQDPDVWTDFETAQKWTDKLPGYELAFNIHNREEYPGKTFLLVDYDDARNPDTGEIHPTVREHLQRAGPTRTSPPRGQASISSAVRRSRTASRPSTRNFRTQTASPTPR